MTADIVRRIANRRRIIQQLRSAAESSEMTARELRGEADRMEEETDISEYDLLYSDPRDENQ